MNHRVCTIDMDGRPAVLGYFRSDVQAEAECDRFPADCPVWAESFDPDYGWECR